MGFHQVGLMKIHIKWTSSMTAQPASPMAGWAKAAVTVSNWAHVGWDDALLALPIPKPFHETIVMVMAKNIRHNPYVCLAIFKTGRIWQHNGMPKFLLHYDSKTLQKHVVRSSKFIRTLPLHMSCVHRSFEHAGIWQCLNVFASDSLAHACPPNKLSHVHFLALFFSRQLF